MRFKTSSKQYRISYAKKLSVKIAARFGKTAVAMTGGFDSRLVFGSLNSAPNNDITLVHGVSSGTEKEDMEIAQNIAKHYHKDFILEDWNNRKGFNLKPVQYFQNSRLLQLCRFRKQVMLQ